MCIRDSLHIQGEATPLRQLNPQIPYSLEQIVAKCMEKKPERRYLSASELIADLKRSIMEPNGDFVKLVAPIVDNSPTINISEREVNEIRRAAGAANDDYEPRRNVRNRSITDFDDIEDDEEDDDDEINPKLDKIFFIGGIGLAVILAIILFVFVGNTLNLWGPKSSTSIDQSPTPSPVVSATPLASATPTATPEVKVALPDIVGKPLNEAIALLDEAKISYKYEEETSDKDLNEVLRVEDAEGKELNAGAQVSLAETIMFYISAGPEAVKVPDVTKLTYERAKTKLESEGFSVTVDYETSEDVEEDAITRTEPTAGTEVPPGSKIIIWRSSGMPKVVVPNVVNQSAKNAKKAIEKAGFVYKEGDAEYSNNVKKGYVISQTPSKGSSEEKGTTVTVILSLGKKPAPVYISQSFIFTAEQLGIDPNSEEEFQLRAVVFQDGKEIEILKTTCKGTELPINGKSVTSSSGNEGVLVMYINGAKLTNNPPVTFTLKE